MMENSSKISARPNVRRLAITAMMIAMEIILHRFLAYQGQSVQINIAFLPIFVVAVAYGPIWSGLAWAIGDTLGTFIAGNGAWFPLFTLTNFISGILMGFFFYRKEIKFVRVLIYVLVNAVFCSLFLQTLFLTVYFNDWAMGFEAGLDSYLTRLGLRLIQNAVLVPVQLAIIYGASKVIKSRSLSKYLS